MLNQIASEDIQATRLYNELAVRLPNLNEAQAFQICRQITLHTYNQANVIVPLDKSKHISLVATQDVLQPMSSKLLAKYIYESGALFKDQVVFDIGTGTGIQAIAAALSGAKAVIASDIVDCAVQCAKINVNNYSLTRKISVSQADLLSQGVHSLLADWIVFAHPYFGDNPLLDYPVTIGMLNQGELLQRFMTQVSTFLRPGGRILTMFWSFAGRANDPLLHISKYPDLKLERVLDIQSHNGIQTGAVKIIQLKFDPAR